MTKCGFCGTSILFGGQQAGELRFCNAQCASKGTLVAASQQLPSSIVQQHSCGTTARMGDAIFCLLVGWWGFPWGLIITPVQIGRNLAGMMRSPEDKTPSPALERIVRTTLVAQALRPQPRS